MLGPNFFPSRRQMSKYENTLKVKLEPFMGGFKANLKDVITQTVKRILKLKNYSGNSETLTVKLSAGFDGSGSHVQRAGRNANINTKVENYIYTLKECHNVYALEVFRQSCNGLYRNYFLD